MRLCHIDYFHLQHPQAQPIITSSLSERALNKVATTQAYAATMNTSMRKRMLQLSVSIPKIEERDPFEGNTYLPTLNGFKMDNV